MARWVQSFMSDRTATLKIDSDNPPTLECGLPQGSPILFMLFLSPLLKLGTEGLFRLCGRRGAGRTRPDLSRQRADPHTQGRLGHRVGKKQRNSLRT